MAITKIEEVFLYVRDGGDNVAENIEAMAFMDRSGVPFTKMFYFDAAQSQQTMDVLNTWWTNRADEHKLPPVTKYPFLIYTEVRDDISARNSPIKYLEGLDEIKKIVDIYAINSAA